MLFDLGTKYMMHIGHTLIVTATAFCLAHTIWSRRLTVRCVPSKLLMPPSRPDFCKSIALFFMAQHYWNLTCLMNLITVPWISLVCKEIKIELIVRDVNNQRLPGFCDSMMQGEHAKFMGAITSQVQLNASTTICRPEKLSLSNRPSGVPLSWWTTGRGQVNKGVKVFSIGDEFLLHCFESHLLASICEQLSINDPSIEIPHNVTPHWLEETAPAIVQSSFFRADSKDSQYTFHQSFLRSINQHTYHTTTSSRNKLALGDPILRPYPQQLTYDRHKSTGLYNQGTVVFW